MTGFSVFRQVFGKGANKELTAFLLHFWDSSQDQQGLSWDQHSPEWGSEIFELEWAGDGARGWLLRLLILWGEEGAASAAGAFLPQVEISALGTELQPKKQS